MDTIKLERSESSDSEEFGGRTPKSSSHVDQPSTSSCHWIKLETDNIIDIQAPEKEEFHHNNESKTFQEQLTDETGRFCNKEITKTHERPLHFDQPSSSKFKWVQLDDRDMGDFSDPVFLIDGQEKSENITKSESDYSLLACNVKLESNDSMGELCHGDSKDVIGDSKNCTDHVIDGERNWKTEDGILPEDCACLSAKKEVDENTYSDDNPILEGEIGETHKFENSIVNTNESNRHGVGVQLKKYDMIDYTATGIENPETDIDVVSQNNKNFKCHLCDYTSIQKCAVKRHMDGVHLKERNQKCSICDYVTSQKVNLQKHIKRVHVTEKHHKCDMCDYTAAQKYVLQRHFFKVHLKMKNFSCHMCDYTAVQKCVLQRHIFKVHLKIKNFSCHMCDYTSVQKCDVKRHIDGVHLKEKNQQCTMCDYATSQKGHLQIHIKRVHLNEKAHKCDMCDYTAVQKYVLQRHIDTVHLKIKNHKCHMCDYTAVQMSTIRRHINFVHLKIKKQKCHMCEFTTSAKNKLQIHVSSKHSQEKNYH